MALAKPAAADASDGKGGRAAARPTAQPNGNGAHHEPTNVESAHAIGSAEAVPEEDELPLSVILDENGGPQAGILAGRELTRDLAGRDPQQGRAQAPRSRARRLGLRQDHARAVPHRAAAATRHPRRAHRPQGRSVQLRQPGRLARERPRNSPNVAASARSSPTRSTSPYSRRAALPAVRSQSRCCPTASTSCPSTSSSSWPTSPPPRSARCCTSRTRRRTRSSPARCRSRSASSARATAAR